MRIPNPLLLLLTLAILAQGSVSAAPGRQGPSLPTPWAANVTPTNVLPEYPRPQMVRPQWLSLNGVWDCELVQRGTTNQVAASFIKADESASNATQAAPVLGQALVPYPLESALCGPKRAVTEQHRIWYHRKFRIPGAWGQQRIWLHFDAVDCETEVWVNGKHLGQHRGGYDRFSFDITDALTTGAEQDLALAVVDPSDGGYQPRGKQSRNPHGIWYTPCSGIWQTVWLEPAPATAIDSLRLVPDVDQSNLRITVMVRGSTNDITVEAVALAAEREVARAKGTPGLTFALPVPQAALWSPETPFLYGLKLRLMANGQEIDQVTSYFGMRKISVGKDRAGILRLMLNNRSYFQLGPLDQGYWPDGIYTAPTDEALRSDIETMRKLGFNMCRKHVKVEPDRWYYWCDKLGLMVWQDMPSGDQFASVQKREIVRRPESARQFELELDRMVQQHLNHPSIVVWIPFNEGWGQYDTTNIVNRIKQMDLSRPVINTSGWHDIPVGDIRSLHRYPVPLKVELDGQRACVIGECGGFGLPITGHLWNSEVPWGYTRLKKPEDLAALYQSLIQTLRGFAVTNGLSGAVFTQLTDVENEANGLLTYDRRVTKLDPAFIATLNRQLAGDAPFVQTPTPLTEKSAR